MTRCGGGRPDDERRGRAPPDRALAGGHRAGAGETPREREECARQRCEQGPLRSPAPGAASAPVNERREDGSVRGLRDFSRLPGAHPTLRGGGGSGKRSGSILCQRPPAGPRPPTPGTCWSPPLNPLVRGPWSSELCALGLAKCIKITGKEKA